MIEGKSRRLATTLVLWRVGWTPQYRKAHREYQGCIDSNAVSALCAHTVCEFDQSLDLRVSNDATA